MEMAQVCRVTHTFLVICYEDLDDSIHIYIWRKASRVRFLCVALRQDASGYDFYFRQHLF